MNTIAELKALDVTKLVDGRNVYVSGYYAENDGGGGIFVYDATSTATQDNGSVIKPTRGSGRYLATFDGTINIRRFGANGDGVTDDSAAIQATIDYASANSKTVYVPSGVYKIDSTVTVSGSNRSIVGDGPGSVFYTESNIPMLRVDTTDTACYHFLIEGLTFRGSVTGTRTSNVGIEVYASGGYQQCNYGTYRNLRFQGVYYGIHINKNQTDGSYNEVGFDWNQFSNIQTPSGTLYVHDAIHFSYGSGTGNCFSTLNLVTENHALHFGSDGTNNIGDIVITNLQCGGGGSTGVFLDPNANYKERVSVTNSQFDGGTTTGVNADGYAHLKIKGCLLGGASQHVLTNCSYIELDGEFSHESRYGIYQGASGTADNEICSVTIPATYRGVTVTIITNYLLQSIGGGVLETTFHLVRGGTASVSVFESSSSIGGAGIAYHQATATNSVVAFVTKHSGTSGAHTFRNQVKIIGRNFEYAVA